nr:ribonuclease H-like domain-containing protein [Tanacetum cinerariifolium]
MKEIKKEFSVVRTLQQNKVAERKNKTLIKAARTMLADSKLPITFWAESVNTACYVQNRVLVIKPHNMTPYELLLGKFNGKSDEGFFVGYSTQRNAGTKEHFDADQARKKTIPDQEYILLPLWSKDSFLSPDDGIKPLGEKVKKDAESPGKEVPRQESQEKETTINNTNNDTAVSSTDLADGLKDNDGHTQEEGIDYDEVFAPVARIEAIRLFLAYASFMGFMVYQMDVKSAFLDAKIGKIDQTLFIKKQKGDILLVQVYVDDIILGFTRK